MPRRESAIPVGTQFSPALLDLPAFLQALATHSGDRDRLEQVIWTSPVYIGPRTAAPSSSRNRRLPLEAAVQYGLLERRTYEATDLAKQLVGMPDDDLYRAFARHILLNLAGLRVVEACREMRTDGLVITGDTLARYLTAQGFPVTEHNTQINTMRMWLGKAGIFPSGRSDAWEVDDDAVERVLETPRETIGILTTLEEDQRAFVEALCAIDPDDWFPAAAVRDQAEVMSGLRLARGSLPNDYLRPLERAGLIEYQTRGTSGGKSSILRTTDMFNTDVLEPFIRNAVRSLDPVLTAYYTTKPADIYRDLASDDTFVKGRALEAYAVHVMRLLGLRFLAWRKRGEETKGAEVDALLAGVLGGIPTRWQVQCKNTPAGRVDLEDVAKEVGLLPLSNATHIMLIANAPFTADARRYADGIMKNTSTTIYLLDKDDFALMQENPVNLAMILRTRARAILRDPPPRSIWHR